jgi:hypothetical protein
VLESIAEQDRQNYALSPATLSNYAEQHRTSLVWPEITMNSATHTVSSLSREPRRHRAHPRSVPLWTPPYQRLLGAIAAAATRLHSAWRESVERRAQVRSARQLQAALAALDGRTLRDIGLGDWMASASEADTSQLQRELTLRGY